MQHRRSLVAAFAVLGAVVAAACQPVAPPPPPPAVPLCQLAPGSTIPGQWVASVDPDGSAPPEVVTFEAPTDAAKADEIEELDEDGTVLTVEPDRVVAALDVVTPGDDPQYAPLQQSALTEAGFPGAWSAGFGGQGVKIAILDSGVQANHEDLQGRVAAGADLVAGTSASPQGTTDFARIDPYGHGTHVAGIAAANDNVLGGIGGAPLASILPVRVLNSCGSGSFGKVAQGIEWAAQQGANVISMSLGGGGSCTGAIATAVTTARAAGVLLVAAAGNDNAETVGVPANCAGVLAVGASTKVGSFAERASFSNYGSAVDIAAPGSPIFSTYIPAPATYRQLNGTSMATPFVSAAAALVVQRCLALLPTGIGRGNRVAELLLNNKGPMVTFNRPQALRISASGGTYALTYPSTPVQATSPIAFNADAASVRAALELLPAIGTGNVTVVSRPVATGEIARFEITLLGSAASSNLLTVDASSLTGAGAAAAAPSLFPGRLNAAAAIAAPCV